MFFYASIPFPPTYNQSIPIYLSICIYNRNQSITTRIFAIDLSSIININRLIDIDWYRLISIVIDYRFHRLDTPGICQGFSLSTQHPQASNGLWAHHAFFFRYERDVRVAVDHFVTSPSLCHFPWVFTKPNSFRFWRTCISSERKRTRATSKREDLCFYIISVVIVLFQFLFL